MRGVGQNNMSRPARSVRWHVPQMNGMRLQSPPVFLVSVMPHPSEADIVEEQKYFANVVTTFQQYASYAVRFISLIVMSDSEGDDD